MHNSFAAYHLDRRCGVISRTGGVDSVLSNRSLLDFRIDCILLCHSLRHNVIESSSDYCI